MAATKEYNYIYNIIIVPENFNCFFTFWCYKADCKVKTGRHGAGEAEPGRVRRRRVEQTAGVLS